MLVGIDASRATTPRNRTENYSVGLIRALVERGQHEYRLYYRDRLAPELEGLPADYCRLPARRLWTHTRLAWELVRRPPDAQPPSSCPLLSDLPQVGVWSRSTTWAFAYSPRRTPCRRGSTLTSARAGRRGGLPLASRLEATRQIGPPLRRRARPSASSYPSVDARFTPVPEPGERERLAATYGLPVRMFCMSGRSNLGRMWGR
ncbi:MAG: hypothetical protein KIT87_17560 [Anaerolineae bacterium]|nr:hypothetical protein [Anaerolineae bacterium]